AQRYRRLNWSGERGNRVRGSLVRQGWLEAAVIPLRRTRKTVLRLTATARQVLGERLGTRESVAHEYWKRHWAARLEREGYAVATEAPRHGGRVDVLAVREQERLGVEIETGQSDFVENVRNSLASGFSRVLVVCTTEQALSAVEQQLARAGLLIPARVQLALREVTL